MQDFMNFVDEVKAAIPEFLNEGNYAVSVQQVVKNNDQVITGLTIRRENENVAPVIYLEPFYEEYTGGEMFIVYLQKLQTLIINIVICNLIILV